MLDFREILIYGGLMKLETLVADINKKYNFGLSSGSITSVVASLKFADIPDDVFSNSVGMVTEVVKSACAVHSSRVQATVGEPATDVDTCPLCKASLQDVTLVNDRKARYCPVHKVALPPYPGK